MMNAILVLAALAASPAAQHEHGPAREFKQRCASCHFVPDTSLAADRAWLGMLKTTA